MESSRTITVRSRAFHSGAVADAARSVPGEAVEEAAAARGAGLGTQRPAARERIVHLDETRGDRAEALLVAQIQLVRDALAEGEHAVLQLAGAAERHFIETEALRE